MHATDYSALSNILIYLKDNRTCHLHELKLMKDKIMDFNFETEKIDALIQLAIQEDIGTGDITTENLIPDSLIAAGALLQRKAALLQDCPLLNTFSQS